MYFLGIEYYLRYTDSSKFCETCEITCEILIVIIPKNSILYLSDLTDLLLVRMPSCLNVETKPMTKW